MRFLCPYAALTCFLRALFAVNLLALIFTGTGARAVAEALASLGANTEHERGGGDVAERLRSLDTPARSLPPAVLGALIFALHGAVALAALDAAHHGSELVLAWLR